MKAPDRCVYCNGENPDCGFCDNGVPLDTQEDWDASWGPILRTINKPIKRTPRVRGQGGPSAD